MKRFLTRNWLLRHAIVLVLVTTFIALGLWQLDRAHNGSAISWGYSFQWPVFALFVGWLWAREMRDELRAERGDVEPEPPLVSPYSTASRTSSTETTGDDDTDVYNRYLAWLSANPDRNPRDYPGEGPHG